MHHDNDFEVGDRIQKCLANDTIVVGTISKVNEMNLATITWDNSSVEENVDLDILERETSELEKEFKRVANSVLEQIEKKIEEAHTALNAAVELSEAHGIPFHSSISPLSQSYFPTSFQVKFESLDKYSVSDITGAYSEYTDGGWAHSAIC